MGFIEPLLEEAVAAYAARDVDFFVNLQSADDPAKFIQLNWELLNFTYPSIEPPLETLAAHNITLPSGVTLFEWEPGVNAAFDHPAERLGELAAFVEVYIARVLQIEPRLDAFIRR